MTEEIKPIRVKLGKTYILTSANQDGKPQTVVVMLVANVQKSKYQVIHFKNEKEKILTTSNYDRSNQTLTIGAEDFTLAKIPSEKGTRTQSNVVRDQTAVPKIAMALAGIVSELDGKNLLLKCFTDASGNSYRVAIGPVRASKVVVSKVSAKDKGKGKK